MGVSRSGSSLPRYQRGDLWGEEVPTMRCRHSSVVFFEAGLVLLADWLTWGMLVA